MNSFVSFHTFNTSDYSSEIAPTGHPPAHEPQLMHVSGLISNLPSPAEIAPTGHVPSQAPQLTQASPITNAIFVSSLIISFILL